MPTITLINEGVMMCRFCSLHAKLIRGDVDAALKFTKETLDVMKNAVENEMSAELTEYYQEVLERTAMELKHRMMSDCTFERIWTLAYTNNLYM